MVELTSGETQLQQAIDASIGRLRPEFEFFDEEEVQINTACLVSLNADEH